MFRKLVNTEEIEIDDRTYVVRYFELRTARGGRRYSCEVLLEAADRIIVDDDSLTSLESQRGPAGAGDRLQPSPRRPSRRLKGWAARRRSAVQNKSALWRAFDEAARGR